MTLLEIESIYEMKMAQSVDTGEAREGPGGQKGIDFLGVPSKLEGANILMDFFFFCLLYFVTF